MGSLRFLDLSARGNAVGRTQSEVEAGAAEEVVSHSKVDDVVIAGAQLVEEVVEVVQGLAEEEDSVTEIACN